MFSTKMALFPMEGHSRGSFITFFSTGGVDGFVGSKQKDAFMVKQLLEQACFSIKCPET